MICEVLTAILVVSYVVGILALIHAYTRPHSAWVRADRNRGYWLSTMAILTFFAMGVLVAIAYFVGVVPRLAGSTDEAFRKP